LGWSGDTVAHRREPVVGFKKSNFQWCKMRVFRFLLSFGLLLLPLGTASADEFAKNEEVRRVLRSNGDDTRIPRDIQHFAYFPSELTQQSFRRFVVSRGYRIDDQHAGGANPLPWALIFSKVQAPLDIDAETEVLRVNAEGFAGEYDGWETAVIRKN
jgi:hypothetical protein